MINAKDEAIDHINGRDVELVRIGFGYNLYKLKIIEGSLEDVLKKLDFEYDNSYGSQLLYGFIWYNDGSWSDRGEYDGSEWWQHQKRPPIDVQICPYL